MPRLMLIATVWSLIAAPALCRAGALTGCCTHDDAPISPPACCDDDNRAPSDESPGQAPAQRECGSCADVCRGITKLSEARCLTDLVEHVQPWGGDAGLACPTVSIAVVYVSHDCVLIGLCLPYPASDLPLRI